VIMISLLFDIDNVIIKIQLMSYFQKHLKTVSNDNIPARPVKAVRKE
jgi:hypothetical protein